MKFFMLMIVFMITLYANSCNEKLFSLSAYQNSKESITIKDVLKDISLNCNISISFLDKYSKKAINKKLDFVNIKDYTFDDFLEFLFDEANLFYVYSKDKNRIKVQYYKTQTFSIDYVNAVLKSTSMKTIHSGSSSSTMGNDPNMGGMGGSNSSFSGGNLNNTQGNASSPSMDITEMITESEFTFWDNLKSNISNLFEDKVNTKIFLNKDASLLTVSATKKDLKKVKKYLATLMKKMHKQVLIEAKIIELIYDDSSAKGIDWSQLKISLNGSLSNIPLDGSDVSGSVLGSFSKPMYKLSWNFSTDKFINFLDKYGDVKVLSNPKILTLNNQPAVINVGEQLSYKSQTGSVTTTGGTAAGTNTYSLGSTFVGITLYVIPEVSSDNEIIMKINPVISRLSNENVQTESQTNRELPPDIKVKQMTSIVKVKSNEKVLIGGLISVVKSKYNKKIPLLGYIPGLENIFGHQSNLKTRSEMFIVLVPKVVGVDNMPTIEDMEFENLFKNEKPTVKEK